MFGVGEADKWQLVLFPIGGKRLPVVGPDDNDFCPSLDESVIPLAQLRHVLLAEGSGESPVEYEDDVVLGGKVRGADLPAAEILKNELRCRRIDLNSGHGCPLPCSEAAFDGSYWNERLVFLSAQSDVGAGRIWRIGFAILNLVNPR